MNWGKEHYREFPWRQSRTPYSVLISEILLTRTTATAVLNLYEDFTATYPDVRKLASADRRQLEDLLVRIGYHKRRTNMIIKMANYILRAR